MRFTSRGFASDVAMNLRKTIRLLAVSGLSLFAVSVFAQPASKPPSPVSTGKPLVSGCVEKEGARSGVSREKWVHRPSKGEAELLYYDVPFAVHVPIEVRHEGGIVRISYRVTVEWEHPPKEWGSSGRSYAVDFGLYRTDGKELAKDSVFYDDYGHNTEQKRWRKLVLDADAPIPVWTLPWKFDNPDAERGGSVRIEHEQKEHVPFPKGTVRDSSFVLAPAQPGTYAFWFALDCTSMWPQKEPKREELKAKFYVDVLVSRGERRVDDEEVEYLFGRTKTRPASMPDDKLFLIAKHEIPVVIRRDGWVFQSAEVVIAKGYEKWKNGRVRFKETDGYQYDLALNAQPGATTRMSIRSVKIQDAFKPHHHAEVPAEIEMEENVTWVIEFPKEIPDYGFASMAFGGGSKRTPNLKARAFAHHGSNPETTAWDVSWNPRIQSGDNFGRHASRVLYTEKDYGNPFQPDREYFTKEYGADAAAWWVGDQRKYDSIYQGPKEGDAPFRDVFRGYAPLGERRLITGDGGTYTLLVYDMGPWRVMGHYVRLSQSRGKPTSGAMPIAGDATVVDEADDFWVKWYPELSAVLAKQIPIADKAVADAKLETIPLQQRLKSQKRLLQSLSGDPNPPGVFESISEWLDNAFPKTGIGTLPGGSEAGSVNKPVERSEAATTNLRNKLGQITEDIRRARERISDRTEEARAAYKTILAKLEEGNEKYGGPAHGELYLWRQRYRKIYERIAFDIAVESKDPEILKQALADAESQANSDQTRVYEAQLHLVLGDAVSALFALRSAVAVNPNNVAAQKMLRDLECAFLKTAIDKSQGAIAQARKAFNTYMMERGFAEYHQLRQGGNWPFARAMAWTEYSLNKHGELPWAIFTTGIFGSFSVYHGKLGAQEDLLKITEVQMVTAYLGLNTILRLRGNGHTFASIGTMTSSEIRYALPLRKLDGTLYNDTEAAWHAVSVREAMKLPDVQALMAVDPPEWVKKQGTAGRTDKLGLQLGLDKKYWSNKDVGDTWIEWIGDATSMFNLLMLLPGAKVGAGSRMTKVFWGEAEIEAILAYEKSGQVITGTEFVANTIGITQFLGAAGATDTGRAILGYLKDLGRYEASLAWYDKVVWTTGKLTAMLTINFTTVIATEKLFGHKAAMLMQCALMFGSDPEVLVKMLDARNIPRQKVAELIINEYLPATRVHLKRLAQIEKSSFEMEQLFAQVKKGRPLSADDFVFLDKYFEKDWRKLIPNGKASNDSAIALGAAAEGAKNNVNNGAGRAVAEKLKAARQAEVEATKKAAEEGQKIANALQGAQPAARAPPPFKPPTVPRDLQRVLPGTRRGATAASYPGRAKYPKPPVAQEMSEAAAAEALLMSGKYQEAEDKFADIIRRVLKGELQEADELPLEWLRLKQCLAHELDNLPKETIERILGPKKPSGLTTPLNKAEIEKILNDPNLWEKAADITPGAFGNIHGVKGNPNLIVKEVPHELPVFHNGKPVIDPATGKQKINRINVLEDVQNTIVHNEMARALGFEVPAMEVKIIYNADGVATKAIYVMRKVNGKPLKDLSAAEIFLYKQQMSRHRALAVVLNDYDRHIGNYLVTAEGHLVPIDAGVADVLGKRAMGKEGAAHPLIMEGAFGRDHWYSRHFKDEICGELGDAAPEIDLFHPEEGFSRKGLVAEESLTYKDSLPTIKDIDNLVNDNLVKEGEKTFSDRIKATYENTFKTDDIVKHRIEIAKAVKERANVERAKKGMDALKIDMDEIRREVIEAIDDEIKEMTKSTVEAAKAREEGLNAVMKGLDKRHVVPRGSQGFIPNELFNRVVFLHIINHAAFRKAA